MISEYIRAGAFFTISILLIIHFIFLFKKNTSYIAWIIGFVLFTIYPFTWIEDALTYSKTTVPKGNTETKIYYWGTVISLIFAVVLEITTLIMIIMTNDYIRKKSNHEDGSQEEEKEEDDSKDKKMNTLIGKNTLKVKIMYVTTTALIVGMILNMFIGLSLNETDIQKINAASIKDGTPQLSIKNQSKMGLFIKNLFEFIPIKVNIFETWWRDQLDRIYAPRLLKAFFLFCGGFLIPFFTIFVKVAPSTKQYDIYFPAMFRTNIKEKMYFIFLALMLSFAVTVMAVWFFSLILNMYAFYNDQSGNNDWADTKNKILLGVGVLSFVLNNVLFNSEYNAKNHENDYIFVLISFCFALLGTPITFSILELLARILGRYLTDYPLSTNTLLFTIFASYWLGISIGGKKWMKDMNNKKLRMIIVTIICMAIGMFFALSTHYKVFTMFFGLLTFGIRSILKYLGPIAILVLSACQIFFANQSFHRKDNTTDDYNDASSTFKRL